MNKVRKATVIGDGGWGTALALVLQRNGHDVTVWGYDEEVVEGIKARHENHYYLPGIPLPPEINWTSDKAAATEDSDIFVIAVPSKFYEGVMSSFKGLLKPEHHIVSVSKGLRNDQRLSTIAEKALDHPAIAALSGPSHAEEVAKGVPSAVVVACKEAERAEVLQEAFNGNGFRVYSSDDIIGVEIGGAMKNVIAIAAGVSDGIGYGDNTKAALITRGLTEIVRLGTAVGGKPQTFYGLSGMGDLIVTCASKHSRNRGFGERLGRGETREEIAASMRMVAEGVWNAETAWHLAQKLNLDLPITHEVFKVLYEDKDPTQAVIDLLSRDPKPE
ncbi:MAG: glycerol-3-phosphate dehydrogenase (NAD(P)+) [Candidatus Omnitrophota bacterium]|jgi:glycerol-3-phosphate dehydrogenase (NAD(P)+)